MNKPTCSVDGCEKAIRVRGYCNAHYLRLNRYGDPLAGGQSRIRDPETKFKERTRRQGDCLVWVAGRKSSGYGKMAVGGRHMPVHRYAWERANGPIPPGMEIDHRCHNRLCCNIDHLRLVTHKENGENHQGPLVTSSTGIRGVHWNNQRQKYHAEVKHNQKKYHAGFFDSLDEAEAAVIAKRNELFTHNDMDRRAAPQQNLAVPRIPCFTW